MRHQEGGWPKEVDPTDTQEVAKWRKRAERDPGERHEVWGVSAEATFRLSHRDYRLSALPPWLFATGFLQSVKHLTSESTRILQQNMAADLFEEYFSDVEVAKCGEKLSVRSLALLK